MAQQLQHAQEKPNDWKIDWNIDEKDEDYKETKIRYTTECSALFDQEEQTAMFKVLAAGKKIQKPLLLYLVDSYTRSRINTYKKDKNFLSVQEWVENDPQIQTLTGNNENHQNLLKSAIDLFYKRFNSPVNFTVIEKINDTIRPFAIYVEEALDFIRQLLVTDKNAPLPPFQFDLWILPKSIEQDDDSEEEYEDDDDDPDESKQIESDNYDIDESLHGIPYIRHERKGDRRRVFMDTYKKFIKLKTIQRLKGFPRNKRLIMIADRRNKNNDMFGNDATQDGDKIYMYAPPKGNEIPNDHLYEKFIQTSAEFVLPGSKHCKQVTAKTGSSNYFMLSFHVEAEDEIRCYMYHRSQIWRFFPQDILDVWPCFFAECDGDNEEFVKAQKLMEHKDGIEQFVKDLEIPDVKFENSPFQK